MYSQVKSIILKLRVWGWKGIWSFVCVRYDALRARRILMRNASAHKHVAPARGITVIGPLSMQYSNSKAIRDFAFALKKAGIPFQTFDINRKPEIPIGDYADILTPLDEFQVTKYDHVVEIF